MFVTRRKEAKAVDRVILHIDMNNFYASVETLYDPSLKDIPMAVGGDKERRHGIVLAKNMLAKAKGVKTAEACGKRNANAPASSSSRRILSATQSIRALQRRSTCSTPTWWKASA